MATAESQAQTISFDSGSLGHLLDGRYADRLPVVASEVPGLARVVVRTDCAPVVRSRMPSSDSFRIAVHEVRERCRRGWRVVRYVSRKANPAHELAREGLKSLSRQQVLVAA